MNSFGTINAYLMPEISFLPTSPRHFYGLNFKEIRLDIFPFRNSLTLKMKSTWAVGGCSGVAVRDRSRVFFSRISSAPIYRLWSILTQKIETKKIHHRDGQTKTLNFSNPSSVPATLEHFEINHFEHCP